MRRMTTMLLAGALVAAPLAGSAVAEEARRPIAESAPAKSQPGAMDMMRSDDIIGSDVFDKDKQELGSVKELLIGKDGKVKAAVISLGGVFGVGDRKVQVPWDQLQLQPKPDDPKEMMVTASRETLQNAPQFEEPGFTARMKDALSPGSDADSRAAGADPRAGMAAE